METRQVLLVDAFATEPLSGVPIPVAPDGEWTDSQLRTLADEFGACGAVTFDGDGDCDGLRYVERDGCHVPASAAVAGYTGLLERGVIEPGTYTLTAQQSQGPDEFTVSAGSEREVSVAFPPQQVEQAAVSTGEIAAALGVDEGALADVSADLPPGRADGFGGTLLVPVNFLQHLAGASPDAHALASLFEETGTCRAFAFTFDTLGADADVHARMLTADGERAVSGVASAGCGAYLSRHAAFDAGTGRIRVESGHFLDRPATLVVTLSDSPRVSGYGLVVLDGTITVPADDDDEIIEV